MPSKPKKKNPSKLRIKRQKMMNLKGSKNKENFDEMNSQSYIRPDMDLDTLTSDSLYPERPRSSNAIFENLQPVSPSFFVESVDESPKDLESPRDTSSSLISNYVHSQEPEHINVLLKEAQSELHIELTDHQSNSPDKFGNTCNQVTPPPSVYNSSEEYCEFEEIRNQVTPLPDASNSPEDYCFNVEPECEEKSKKDISGRRIVDIMFFLKQLQETSHESLFQCNFNHLNLVVEKRIGLISHFTFQCDLCKKIFKVKSDDPNNKQNVDVNIAAVTGIVASGIGYSQFEEVFGAADIPIFGENYYAKIQDKVFDEWESTAVEVMERAAAREREAAVQEGRFYNGIPVIDVYADAAWCKRSFGNNYKALSGVAAIVGRRFGEVLYIGVKNKYCLICARAKKCNKEPKDHKCYKNYEGSSSGMEAMVVSEGFKESINMYGLIYGSLVADGDSSTYAKILASDPYPGFTVSKIECRNHLLRNMCNKLRALGKDTKYPKKQRNLITNEKVMSMRKVITTSITKNKELPRESAINELHETITNAVNHAYGDHRKCKTYYCQKDKDILAATVAENEHSPFWFRLKVILNAVAAKTRSLLEDVDTNSVERFNSIVAKFVGGKRINFATKRSYQSRCSAAVVSFNTRQPIYTLHKRILGRSPRSKVKKLEQKRAQKRKLANLTHRKKNRSKTFEKQNDYGPRAAAPDMTETEFSKATADFMTHLKAMVNDRKGIQERTTRQRESSEWLQIRKLMITASNFGAVVKRKRNFAKLVKNILYKNNISGVAAVAHGIKNEKFAIEQLSSQENIQIKDCGLFVDEEFPFIAATPDGIVDEDTIVEVKCPVAAYKNGIQNAIKENKVQIIKFNKKSSTVTINKNSNWYYQIQGQLRVTGKKRCVLGIWGGEREKMEVIYIKKDDDFWKKTWKQN